MPFSTNSASANSRELDALFPGQLTRNGEFDLAGKLRVLAPLGGLDRIPELFAVGNSCGAPSDSSTSEWMEAEEEKGVCSGKRRQRSNLMRATANRILLRQG